MTTSLGAEEPVDGWFPVERPDKRTADDEEIDPSIWVVFAKRLPQEGFIVRFPEDPSYQISPSKALEIVSSKEGEEFKLWVRERGEVVDPFDQRLEEILATPEFLLVNIDEIAQEILYQRQGKWVREHFFVSSSNIFVFQTTNVTSDAKNHQFFVNSFQLQ